mmetsp:Transcript_16782/g.25062  ORF Transcript_16782/g.25062 Transcript_16782/m.25062 type:complete len:104 (-) Transcript_16782:54-365(-)
MSSGAPKPYTSELFNTRLGDFGSYFSKYKGSHWKNFRIWYNNYYFKGGRSGHYVYMFWTVVTVNYLMHSMNRRNMVGPDGNHIFHGTPTKYAHHVEHEHDDFC